MMTVLPTLTEEEKQQHSASECRDDYDEISTATSSATSASGTEREDRGTASSRKNILLLPANSMIDSSGMASDTDNVGNSNSSTPRRNERNSPAVSSMMGDEDYGGDFHLDPGYVKAFASHAADACVACSIPVLHFIQFFMC